MKPLFFNFIKRFILVPVLLTVIVVIVVGIKLPSVVADSQNVTVITSPVVDTDKYNLVSYKSFKDLKSGDYVATVFCEELQINCAACFDSSAELHAAEVLKQSKEPWNKGNVAIVGDNLTTQFKYLHNAGIGTEIVVDYYHNETCTYSIKKIVDVSNIEDVIEYLKQYNLVLCIPYVDFDSPTGSMLYHVYLAELGGVELWK